ncbi:hypothetical protein V2S66_03125 [Streptomyces sp. V4-01]|uniref:Uncharacterized protein n=1 Tax=Actinacidiphila polyblastidii TaxID=3110430 RepID=A0ABU7P575_9ACTN|nr:hypothetical protein [Streptomyces sp. V4-01]
MIRLLLPAANDIAELVDALLDAADTCQTRAPDLAARRRALADQIGDALDQLPTPTIREDHDTP